MYKVLKNEEEYEKALEEAELLMDQDPEKGTEEADKLELLTLLITKYEDEHYPIDFPDPVEAIKFRMEQEGLERKDLIPFFGSASKISEVFSGKRPLTLRMIRDLHNGLGIPAEVLINESEKQKSEENVEAL